MIMIGWYEKDFWTNRPKDIECYNCKAKSQGIIKGSVNILHIFYLPIFPYKIKHEFECVNCKSALGYNDMDSELKKRYNKYRTKRIPPLWCFSGLIIIFSLVIWNKVSDYKEMAITKSRLENIEKNRVVELKTDDSEYTTVKISEVSEDMIKLNYNLYQVMEENEISRINDKYNYSKDTLELERSILLKWFNEGKVIGIHW